MTDQPHYEWVPDLELNRQLKRLYAPERKEQAQGWRRARRANPKIARLLWRRMRDAERKFADDLYSEGNTGGGGLSELLK